MTPARFADAWFARLALLLTDAGLVVAAAMVVVGVAIVLSRGKKKGGGS